MKKPNIMFQGTGSSVGKSILTAGVCRMLNNRGYRVAPFKSQNMALNSFITRDGKEMGRAQVVQAEAARIEPQVEMNPILLKPSSDVGSQVILLGEVYKNMDATTYHAFKPELGGIVMEAYRSLEKDVDCIVLEGAGSPAEINLRDNDIVNMGMAQMCDAPVVLIGDIDRGGVFASLYGTYMLLEEEEKKRIKGFVINKFRGDVRLLQSGIDMLEEKIHVPCLGVIPYFHLHIDDEDSVSMRFAHRGEKHITVGVIRLPHISNFTDFTPFEMEDDVEVRYVRTPQELNGVDMVILPGSKNTIEDMIYVKEMGLAEKILALHQEKVPVFGICGGYQILGKRITDTGNHESAVETMDGLGLVDAETVIAEKKRTVQVKGILDARYQGQALTGEVTGYKIHMGVTTYHQDYRPLIRFENGETDGVWLEDGSVIGTYMHGIFDNVEPRKTILDTIRRKKGLEEGTGEESFAQFKERQYDMLASLLEEHIDMEAILNIMKGSEG